MTLLNNRLPLHWKEQYVCVKTTLLCPEKIQAEDGWEKITRTPTANLLLFPSTELSISSLFTPSLPSFLPVPLPLTWESFSVFATRASKAKSVFCCPSEMSLTQKCWIFEGIFKVSPLSLPLARAVWDIFPYLQQTLEDSPWSILRFLPSPWHCNEM